MSTTIHDDDGEELVPDDGVDRDFSLGFVSQLQEEGYCSGGEVEAESGEVQPEEIEKETEKGPPEFGRHPISGFPWPTSGEFIDATHIGAYDLILEREMTMVQPWPCQDTGRMAPQDRMIYTTDLLRHKTLAPMFMRNGADNIVADDLMSRLLWLVSLPSALGIISYLWSRWMRSHFGYSAMERIMNKQQQFLSCYDVWDAKHDLSKLPYWAVAACSAVRQSSRPPKAMTQLELLCQLAFIVPDVVSADLKALQASLLDVAIAKSHMIAMAEPVITKGATEVCRYTPQLCTFQRQFSDFATAVSVYDQSKGVPYHHLVWEWGVGFPQGTTSPPNNIILTAPPNMPCGCCTWPLGQYMFGWIRCWLRPGMYVFVPKQHKDINTRELAYTSWHPQIVTKLTEEQDTSSKRRKVTKNRSITYVNATDLVLETQDPPADLDITLGEQKLVTARHHRFASSTISKKQKKQWVLKADTRVNTGGSETNVNWYTNDGLYCYFDRHDAYDQDPCLPLLGFAPAYVALAAQSLVSDHLPQVLAGVVYQYMKCNI